MEGNCVQKCDDMVWKHDDFIHKIIYLDDGNFAAVSKEKGIYVFNWEEEKTEKYLEKQVLNAEKLDKN